MENKENERPGGTEDDRVSMTSSEVERRVEAELARMVEDAGEGEAPEPLRLSFDKDDDDSDGDLGDKRNPAFDQSHTSFKSMKSDATILSQHQRQLEQLVQQDIGEQEDLDDYLEKLLAIQRSKGAIMQKRLQESEEWKAIKDNQKK